MTTLTLDGYDRMPEDVRADFMDWLKAEGLDSAWIVEGDFDGEQLRAKCIEKDEQGEAVFDDAADDVRYVERTFTLKTPPPPSALAFAK